MIAQLLTITLISAGLGLLSYTILVPWWRSAAGRAYFALNFAFFCTIGLFVYEALEQPVSDLMEATLIIFVNLVFAGNVATFAYAQISHFRSQKRGQAFGVPTPTDPAPIREKETKR